MTTTSSTASSGASIVSALNAGAGIDTGVLVSSLVEASYAGKLETQAAKETANTARISTLATLKQAISSFSSALTTLINGGSLSSQPSSSDSGVLTATANAGARLTSLSAQIEVRQVAQAQSLVSAPLASAGTAVGQGDLVLAGAAGSFTITIDPAHDSLTGLAQQINAANAGVTATVITDGSGARLMLKGATGEANSFSLTPAAGADPGLARFAFDGTPGGMTRAQEAKDAIVRIDGVDVTRSSNTISDLIDGVTLKLAAEKPGTIVTLGIQRPAAAITQAVNDFVAAFNMLKREIDAATAPGIGADAGPFTGNSSVKTMLTELGRLTATKLSTSGGPSTLAEIGVQTARDGSLSVDASKLARMLGDDPLGVEALFNPTQYSDNPMVRIASAMGTTKPGTYPVGDLVAGNPASGTIAGMAGIASGTRLAASVASPAAGLILEPLGNVGGATITVDPGLGGALKALAASLTASDGLLGAMSEKLTTETRALANARDKLEMMQTAYRDQLTRQFTAMNTRVSAFKATQSYLTQQIAMWSKGS